MYQVITNADREVLRETCRCAKRAAESIYSVISRIDDEDLALDLNRQVCRYNAISDRAEEALTKAGQCTEEGGVRSLLHGAAMRQRLRRMSNAFCQRSCAQIAEMVIEDNRRALAHTRKVLRENRNAGEKYCEMADELIAFEEKSICKLKDYL